MAQPSQELPPWLTLATTTITDPTGSPIATAVQTLQLPLTYFGPSIPLGPGWVFGGSTSPASIGIPNTGSTTSTQLPSTSTATPTSSVPSITTEPASSTSSTSASSSVVSPPVSSSATSASSISSTPSSAVLPTSSALPTSVSGSTSSNHAGLIAGIVVGAVAGLVLLIFLCFCLARLKRRRGYIIPTLPIWTDWEMVYPSQPEDDAAQPADRPSSPGDGLHEEDPFLQDSREMQQTRRGPSAPLVIVPRRASEALAAVGGRQGGNIPLMEADLEKKAMQKDELAANTSTDAPNAETTLPQYAAQDPAVLGASALAADAFHRRSEEDDSPVDREILPLLPPRRIIDPNTVWLDRSPSSSAPNLLAAAGRDASLHSLRPPPARNVSGASVPSRVLDRMQNLGALDSAVSLPLSEAEVMTAQRVTVSPRGSQAGNQAASSSSPTQDSRESEAGTSTLGPLPAVGLGIGGLARIGRLSWFRRIQDSPTTSAHGSAEGSRPGSRTSWYSPRTSAALDPENQVAPSSDNRSPLSGTDGFGRRLAPSAYPGDGTGSSRPFHSEGSRGSRPFSTASGGTLYFDAVSRPGTPSTQPSARGREPVPPVPPLPVPAPAASPSGNGTTSPREVQRPRGGVASDLYPDLDVLAASVDAHGRAASEPPAYDDLSERDMTMRAPLVDGVDALDLPVPRPSSPFANAASSSVSSSSLSQGATSSAFGRLPTPAIWDDQSSSQSRTGTGSASGSATGMVITVDSLEEAPPPAMDRWRAMAEGGRRMTFGMPTVVHPIDPRTSERGSLHSRSVHSIPGSSRGSDSAPPSGRYIPVASIGSGSGSSRRSHFQDRSGSSSRRSHLQDRSGSSGAAGASLSHSGSISSDGRRRPTRREAGEIPMPSSPHLSLSAVGPSASASRLQFPPTPSLSRLHASSPTFSDFGARPPVTGAGTNSTTSTHMSVVDPMTGAVMHFPSVPWTGGLERDWPADAWTEIPGSGGARWWGPPSQMMTMRRVAQGDVDDTQFV